MSKNKRKNTLHESAIEAGRNVGNGISKAKYNKTKVQEKEGIRKAHTSSYIEQLDNLNAIYRWLRSKVDQRWNKVYSLLTKELGEGLAGEHIKGHVDSMVERYPTYNSKNQPCYAQKRGYKTNMPLCQNEFYVDRGGHLREGKYSPLQRFRYSLAIIDRGLSKQEDKLIYHTEHGRFTTYTIHSKLPMNSKLLIREKNSKTLWKFSRTIPAGYDYILGPFKPVV